MSDFISFLQAFNRKERFFLLKSALGGFSLSESYRDRLGKVLGLEIPQSAYVAMDYHLTWLFAAVHLSQRGLSSSSPITPQGNGDGIVRGNQEDIDLLVAFDKGPETHVVLVEAKSSTGWTNQQLDSKAKRLGEIFGRGERADSNGIRPDFVLTSPRESRTIRTETWPKWMAPDGIRWLELSLPENSLRVTRSNSQGRMDRDGGYWTVLPERKRTRR